MLVSQVSDLHVPELHMYTQLNEKQVKRMYEPDVGAFICESVRVIERAIAAGYEPISFFVEEGMEQEVMYLCEGKDTPVYVAPYAVMKEITGYSLTGGVLCAMQRKPLITAEAFVRMHRFIVLLDDIENPTNVGAIFRSAVALGADGVLLTRGSADPLYRRATRVSMGTVFQTDWTYAGDDVIPLLKQSGFETFALALDENAEPLDTCRRRKDQVAVVLGNEDHGIKKSLLLACDRIVMIPMKQGVDSLNVAAASAVAFWELFHK